MESNNFIEDIIIEDLKQKKYDSIITRFPPEPNGYLHLGHAKSICLNFGLTKTFQGKTYLRFDDTNPEAEEEEFVKSIQEDIKWLGFTWDKVTYASDYFSQLYEFAIILIEKGLAYVDDTPFEELTAMRGDLKTPGQATKYRDRSIEENKELFAKMKEGHFENGSRVLRAKIDLHSPIMHLRDPILYRIKKIPHHRTGNQWCIYPTYDFAHGQCDAIEKITHSICTLEFASHRPLYNWLIENIDIFPSKQYEFARLNLTYTIMSKRYLMKLVNKGIVEDWDDPRMPTISGVRRRGFTPSAIRHFCKQIGVAKRDNSIDFGLLEFFVREDLNKIATRAMVVLEPILLTISNYPEQNEKLDYINNPEDESQGSRKITFSKHLWIEKEDISLKPEKNFFRIFKGNMVRLKHAYIIRCDDILTDEQGNIKEVLATYFPESKSGQDKSGLKVKSTIHWVNKHDAVQNEVRVINPLFLNETPSPLEENFSKELNPQSLQKFQAYMEPALNEAKAGHPYQFIRQGYFILDSKYYPTKKIFIKTTSLKDTKKRK